MRNTRGVFILLGSCCIVIIGMIILVNLPREEIKTGSLPVLYPTSVPSQKRTFPQIAPLPVFHSDTTKYQYLGDILYDLPVGFSLPAKMAGYSVDSYSITPDQAGDLARSFGMSSDPEQSSTEQESFLSWKTEAGEMLQIALASGTISYSNSYIPGKSDAVTKLTSKEAVVAAASSFLTNHGLAFSDISAGDTDVTYYTEQGGEPTEVSTFDDATLFAVSYKRKLDGITVFTNYGDSSQISVWVDRFGIIKKASIQYAAVSRGTTQALLGLDVAKSALPKAGVVVHLGTDGRSISQASIKTTTITTISLGYFDDRVAQLFYPIYVFAGTATTEDGATYAITLYLPALAQ